MKILIVNTFELDGGAARAAKRLHNSLLEEEVDSTMLVQKKESNDYTVLGPETDLDRLKARLRPALNRIKFRKYKSKSLFSCSWLPSSSLVNKINSLSPDIVHLHWINAGMLRPEDIPKIKAPIVWTLHDMWPFTGGCHYDNLCGRYTKNCGKCKVLQSQKENDISRKNFKKKKKAYSQKDINIVGLSNWLNESSKKSALLKEHFHINLPNPINTEVFKPISIEISRKIWGLPINKKLILFGAMSATSDARKGFQELKEAINSMELKEVELVIYGSSRPYGKSQFKFKTHYLGQLYDDVSLATLYSAVNTMVVPSLQENLSNIIMESMSCGTPVVGFNIGGNPDLIKHKENGYLAKPLDILDLKGGIEWALNNSHMEKLSNLARANVLANYDSRKVVKKYINLYKEILIKK